MSEKLQIPADTLYHQFEASNPENSSWVSANAGSGKTHVLTQRVIRLMLDGNPPDKILCLTFTKAAAANMKNRVFETLGAWTMMEDAELEDAIENSTGKRPTPKLRKQARQLFVSALDTPGGLKIQTIHGFCESLLHQFPLEANVPGHFEALQELEQTKLLKQARMEILSGNHDADESLDKHFETLINTHSDAAIDAGLAEIISKRNAFIEWVGDDLISAIDRLYTHCGIARDETIETIQLACLHRLEHHESALARIREQAETGSAKSDTDLANALMVFFGDANDKTRLEVMQKVLLTGKLEARKRLATKHVTDTLPDASDTLFLCAQFIIEALDQMRLLTALQNSEHLFFVGLAIIKRYETLKRQHGVIDFDDQIEKTANLLNRSNIQDWIRYRLDNGIDHVLVDEAQDTSPAQWSIINAITSDFHAGEAASNVNRTMFVVGDEKQSVFSFQGAEPKEFALQQKRLQTEVKSVDKTFHDGKLALSFRSTKDVLHAVDRVFEVEENAAGLTLSSQAPVHDAVRANDPGEVQIWPIFEKQKIDEVEDWLAPVDSSTNNDPVIELAEIISRQIGEWVGKSLPGMDRVLKFGDILVLVRKRDRFITALTRTMKDKGLEVAGADRLLLTEHIAIEDLIALGRVTLLPQDDLSLAAVLKGLLFNVDEEMLFRLAYGRGGKSLYENIRAIANNPDHADTQDAAAIIEKLEYIIRISQAHDVFSFYGLALSKMGGRKAILARLGLEAEDVLDSFLEETLTFTREKNGGLEAFIAELTATKPEIKREVELERDEVRILTVHASKGLEARLVFLVDPCGPAWHASLRPKIINTRAGDFLWVSDSASQSDVTNEAYEALKEAAEAEYRRLLYVGMTRAADRLIVCGYKGTREIKHDHWHKMVESALTPTATEMLDSYGNVTGLRWVSEDKPPVQQREEEHVSVPQAASIPNWLFKKVTSYPPLPRPLTPSGAHALIEDITTPVDLADTSAGNDRSFALARGNTIHKLLEMLPDITAEKQATLAKQYLDHVGSFWSEAQRDEVLMHVLNLLTHSVFEQRPNSKTMAEVSLSGILETNKRKLLISGQIDRLIVSDDKIHVLDFKSNRYVPKSSEHAPAEYVTQIALYREMVRQIYGSKTIECSLLWTQTPELMLIPDQLMDKAMETIKNR